MKRHIITLLLFATMGLARADDVGDGALRAAALDCFTTADALDALAGSAREANPIGAVPACVVKPIIVAECEKQREPDRTQCLTANRAVWDGAAANNIAVLLGAHPGGALAIAGMTAITIWAVTEKEREFARQCAIHEQLAGHKLTCDYKSPPHL